MRLITNITQLLLTLLTLALFTWAGYQGYQLLSSKQQVLSPETQAVLVIGAIIILVGGYLLAAAIRRAANTIALTPQKTVVYEKMLKVWKLQEQGEIEKELSELKTDLVLMGSYQVIKKVNQLIAITKKEDINTPIAQKALEELLIIMRKDLGLAPHYNSRKEIKNLLSKKNLKNHINNA